MIPSGCFADAAMPPDVMLFDIFDIVEPWVPLLYFFVLPAVAGLIVLCVFRAKRKKRDNSETPP